METIGISVVSASFGLAFLIVLAHSLKERAKAKARPIGFKIADQWKGIDCSMPPAVPRTPKSLFGWQYSTMFQALWAAKKLRGEPGITARDMAFLKGEARSIRARGGVAELIQPDQVTEAWLITETLGWCAEIYDLKKVRVYS